MSSTVRHRDPELQLSEVLRRFDVVERLAPFTRCLRCNTPVVPVDADAVADRLPPRTRSSFHEFRRCPGGRRVDWQGSHHTGSPG